MRNKEIKDIVYSNVYQNASTGYVLTPSELAFEMISTLPESVFKSESTTFLDPICKSGTFLFEVIEKLYDQGHSVNNIQNRIYTIDSNSHSLNVAESFIKKILNKESGSFKVDYKHEFVERFHNRLISVVSKGKYTTFDDFLSIIILDKKEKYLMVELKNTISDFIAKYEKVSKLESKLFGEVFTPRQLIDEMLDTLPKDVWGNPDLKWLDPAVGIGNFPAAILDRLMVGLESVIQNEDDRRKHILEEMLYMCDISTKNLFLLYMLFDRNNEFKLNVYRGSFLEEGFDKHMKEVWGLDGFDVVVGNPPYQSLDENGNSKRGGNNLYMKFISKSTQICQFLLFITPQSWMAPGNDRSVNKFFFKDYFLKNNLLFVESGVSEDYFKGVGSKFSVFLLNIGDKKKTSTKLRTKINNEIIDTEYILDDNFKFFPTLPNSLALNIFNKVIFSTENKIKFNFDLTYDIRRQPNKKIVDSEFQYPIYNTGSQILYSKFKTKNFDSPKIIISLSGNLNPVFDSGRSGTANNSMHFCIDKDHSDFYLFLLKSKLFKFILKYSKYSGFFTKEVLWSLPDVFDKEIIEDSSLYSYFNLTQEEIDLIEKTIKD
jgi:hypothetical protein